MKKRPGRLRRGSRTTALQSLRTGQPLPAVAAMSVEECRRELVEDAVAGVVGGEPYLKRQVAQYLRIAKSRGVNPDVVFVEVEAEVIALCGRGMPVT